MHSSNVGIVVGSLVPILVACVLLAFLFYRKGARKRIEESHKVKTSAGECQPEIFEADELKDVEEGSGVQLQGSQLETHGEGLSLPLATPLGKPETFEADELKEVEEGSGVQLQRSQLETHGEGLVLPLATPLGESVEEYAEDKIDEAESIQTSFEQGVTLAGEEKQTRTDMQALYTDETEMTQQYMEHGPTQLASSTVVDTEYQPKSSAQTQDQLTEDYIQKETEAVPELGDIRTDQVSEIPRKTESVLDSEEADNLLTSLGVQEMLSGDTENKDGVKKKKKKRTKKKREDEKCANVSNQGSPIKTESEFEGDHAQTRVETETLMSEDADHITEQQAEVGKKRKPRKKGKKRTSREEGGGEESHKVEESPLKSESKHKEVDLVASKDSNQEQDIVMMEKKERKHRKKKRKSVDKGSTSSNHKMDSPDHSEKDKSADKSPKTH